MKKNKTIIAITSILFALVLFFIIFFFSRPLVVFFVGNLDSNYIEELSKPSALTLYYRTKVVVNPDDNSLNNADFIINHSVIGLDKENVYEMEYDPESLIEPYATNLGSDVTYLYDSTDDKEVEILDYLNSRISDLNAVSYESEIGRADHGLFQQRVGDGVIITLSLSETISFLRTLDSPQIAVTYLDAAALEAIEPYIVFSPDWDSLIRENLRKAL